MNRLLLHAANGHTIGNGTASGTSCVSRFPFLGIEPLNQVRVQNYCQLEETLMLKQLFSVGAMLLSITLMGCGGEKLYPVTGTVTVDGSPVEGLQVVFAPENGEGLTGTGTTDAAGKYKIVTMKGAGLPPGNYRVAISKIKALATNRSSEDISQQRSDSAAYQQQFAQRDYASMYEKAEKQKGDQIPEKYNSKTILTATVAATNENVIDFNLSTKD
ncbi:MAG: hypothetical protein KatS3mg111_0679 [Pirellulaceae bacterium]|nr:MAG: hypothetical protein KatS3mg111_0679 [Pirellulaceae bacterium]